MLVALRATVDARGAAPAVAVLLGVVLAQGPSATRSTPPTCPVVLVVVHLLGACLVWVAALRVLLAMSQRVVHVAAAAVDTPAAADLHQ